MADDATIRISPEDLRKQEELTARLEDVEQGLSEEQLQTSIERVGEIAGFLSERLDQIESGLRLVAAIATGRDPGSLSQGEVDVLQGTLGGAQAGLNVANTVNATAKMLGINTGRFGPLVGGALALTGAAAGAAVGAGQEERRKRALGLALQQDNEEFLAEQRLQKRLGALNAPTLDQRRAKVQEQIRREEARRLNSISGALRSRD